MGSPVARVVSEPPGKGRTATAERRSENFLILKEPELVPGPELVLGPELGLGLEE